jgi:hypothetical protein
MPQIQTKPALKLVGEDGNAFSILGRAIRAAKKAGWTPAQIKEYQDKATAGDYNHLLATTMDFFDCDPGDDERDGERGPQGYDEDDEEETQDDED